jgi:hypothetical protein
MLELADIFRVYGPAYRQKYGSQMLPSHHQVMAAIERCRTAVMGGSVYRCQACEVDRYSYHSCRNRHCPKCQNDVAETWLQKQQALLLPVNYFLLTFTLPAELRSVARSNQKLIYNILFSSAASALQLLGSDPRFIGGQMGFMGVLHTWGRDLSYHPHVHFLVPAGGLSFEGNSWLPSRKKFLVSVKALSKLFRAKFRDALKKTSLWSQVPTTVWHKKWVVHSQPVGRGQAALKYLAPYIFRVAISNNRLLSMDNGLVRFRYKASGAKHFSISTLPADSFIHRFLQHVLPKGFVKVRYFGFFSSGKRSVLGQVRHLLAQLYPTPPQLIPPALPEPSLTSTQPTPSCPLCGKPMSFVERLIPALPRPP